MELQALLRQGLANLREQQYRFELAEAEYTQALKDIANISVDVDSFFQKLLDAYNKYVRHLRTPTTLNMKKRERLNYVDEKYEEWLGESIAFHEEAIGILKKTLDAMQGEKVQEFVNREIPGIKHKMKPFGGYRVPVLSSEDLRIVPIDDPTLT